MTAIFTLPALAGGGAETHAIRLMNALSPSTFNVIAAPSRPGGSLMSRLAPHVRLRPLTEGGASSTLQIVRSRNPLRDLIDEVKADVVCSFLELPGIVAASAVRASKRQPVHVACVQNTLSVRYGRGTRASSRIGHRAVLSQVGRSYRQADRIVALTHGVADDFLTLYPELGERVQVIYNAGMDDSVVLARQEPIDVPPGPPLIVACGRLFEQKGYPILLEAIHTVVQSRPVRLWVLGEGPLRGELENQAEALGIAEQVTFLGFQSNPYGYMAAADLFVLSSHYEGFANVVVEALASGAPVVSTDCPHGPGEILSHGETGLLVPPGDPKALAEAILVALGDSELREQFRRAGPARAERFHADVIAREYAAMFRSVVGARIG